MWQKTLLWMNGLLLFFAIGGCHSLRSSSKQTSPPDEIVQKWSEGKFRELAKQFPSPTPDMNSLQAYVIGESAFILGYYDQAFAFYSVSSERVPSRTASILAGLSAILAEGDQEEDLLSLLEDASANTPTTTTLYPPGYQQFTAQFDDFHRATAIPDESARAALYLSLMGLPASSTHEKHFLWSWNNNQGANDRGNRFVRWHQAAQSNNPEIIRGTASLPYGTDYADELMQAALLAATTSLGRGIWPPLLPKTLDWDKMEQFLIANMSNIDRPTLVAICRDLLRTNYRRPQVDRLLIALMDNGYFPAPRRVRQRRKIITIEAFDAQDFRKRISQVQALQTIFAESRNIIVVSAITHDWLRASREGEYVPRTWANLIRRKSSGQ